jgi:hypothetical protein
MHRPFVFNVALAIVLAGSLQAQSRDSLSLDATIGPSVGSGGRRPYYSSNDIAGELTLTFRPHPDRASAWVAALSVGGRTSLEFGDRCVLDVAAGSVCAPAFPAFSHVALLVGIEKQWGIAAVRAFAGPGFYGGGGPSGLGAQVHLDGAVGFTHLALVGVIRGSFVSRFSGETIRAHSLEFGLRLQ